MNELDDIIDFVAAHPPFDLLDEAQVQRLCRRIEISYQSSGTEILGFGADNDELHLIRRGVVGLFDDDGRLVEKRAEGELYGYPSLLTGRPMRFAVRTEEDSLIYHVPGEVFRELRAACDGFDQYFNLALVQRIGQSLEAGREMPLATRNVGQVMSHPVFTVAPETPVWEAARSMSRQSISSVLVVQSGALAGVLTDRDLRRRIVATRRPLDTPVSEVMTPEPICISPEEPAISALLAMTDHGVHHLPVTRADGSLAGIVTVSDLLSTQHSQPVHFVSQIRRSEDVDALAVACRNRLRLLVNLVESGVSAAATARVMTAAADVATRRLLELAENDLGRAPMPYAWIGFGSQARREHTGPSDQDNGLVLADSPGTEEREYFAGLARFVCDGLNRAGFAYCPGDVMATNPRWCDSLEHWQHQFERWIEAPEPKALMYASIFFDMRAIAGDDDLVARLSRHVFSLTAHNQIFLRFMAENALQYRPPLGLFRQFILEDDGDHGEGLNLKKRGVVPITALARMHALESGFERPGTVERLEAALLADGGANADLKSLSDAFELIGRCRLEHQARQIREAGDPDNLVEPTALSPLLRRNLKAAFRVVRTAQQVLSRRYLLD